MLAVKSIGLKAGLTEARMEIQDLIEDYELRTKTMENKVTVFRCKKFVIFRVNYYGYFSGLKVAHPKQTADYQNYI